MSPNITDMIVKILSNLTEIFLPLIVNVLKIVAKIIAMKLNIDRLPEFSQNDLRWILEQLPEKKPNPLRNGVLKMLKII